MGRKSYDCVVIGGGPAGITAAIYLARRKFSVAIIYEKLGGQASLTSDIENYSGFRMISGLDFTNRLKEHLQEYDITEIEDRVLEIKEEKDFRISLRGEEIKARGVVIASGARQKKLGIKGEEEFLNRGVAYCATCDAPLFSGKDVVVVGGGNSAVESALQLKEYAKRVYLLNINQELTGEEILIDKVKACKKIKVICCSKINEIFGSKFVEGISYERQGRPESLNVKGVFVEIGYVPNSEEFKVRKNKAREIIINSKNSTSVNGIFAAGDVTNVPVKQIVVAAGEGAKAGIACAEYLQKIS